MTILALTCLPRLALAADFYVNPGGSDVSSGGTSKGTAWRTLEYALSKVPENKDHVINLAAGTYRENLDLSVGPRISIIGAGAGTTRLVTNLSTAPGGSGDQYQKWFLRLQSATSTNGNQTLADFSIDGNGKLYGGVSIIKRNNVSVRNVRITNMWLTGLDAWSGVLHSKHTPPSVWLRGLLLDGLHLENCGRQFTAFTSGAIHLAGLDGSVIRNCTIIEPNGNGIKQRINGSFGWFRNVDIHDNVIQNTGLDRWGNTISIELYNVQNGNRIYNNSLISNISLINKHWETGGSDGVTNVDIFNNEIGDPDALSYVITAGVEVQAPDIIIRNNVFSHLQTSIFAYSLANNIQVTNNIIFDNKANFYPIQLRPNKPDLSPLSSSQYGISNWMIYNNTFDSSSSGGCVRIQASDGAPCNDIQVRNNIFRNTGTGRFNAATLLQGSTITNGIFSHNYFQNRSTSTAGFIFSNNIESFAEPDLILSGFAPDPFYRPINSSANIVNRGVNVGLPYSGSAPDLGAIELGSAFFGKVGPRTILGTVLFDDAAAPGWSVRQNVGLIQLAQDGHPTRNNSSASIRVQSNNGVRLDSIGSPVLVQQANRFATFYVYWDAAGAGSFERVITRYQDASQTSVSGGSDLYLNGQAVGSGSAILPSRTWVCVQYDMGSLRMGKTISSLEIRSTNAAKMLVDDVQLLPGLISP